MSNPLTTRPPSFDPADYVLADLSALRWMTGADRMAVVAARVAQIVKPPKPLYDPRPQLNPDTEIETYYTMSVQRPAQQVKGEDFDTRSREEVRESTRPSTADYVPQGFFQPLPSRTAATTVSPSQAE